MFSFSLWTKEKLANGFSLLGYLETMSTKSLGYQLGFLKYPIYDTKHIEIKRDAPPNLGNARIIGNRVKKKSHLKVQKWKNTLDPAHQV
jgi:hypothetical protein